METRKMAFKEKFDTWKNNVKDFCEDHKTEIIVGVASIATFVGGALIVKKLGDMANEGMSDADIDRLKGTLEAIKTHNDLYKENMDFLKENGMLEADGFFKEKLKEIHEYCVENNYGINIEACIDPFESFEQTWTNCDYFKYNEDGSFDNYGGCLMFGSDDVN